MATGMVENLTETTTTTTTTRRERERERESIGEGGGVNLFLKVGHNTGYTV